VAYLVGLCHDLGEILLRSTFSREYQQVLEVQAETERPLDELEREMLGMSHSDLVMKILSCLGLPDTIRIPIETFYRIGPETAPPSSTDPLAKILRIANLYANGLLLTSSGASRVMPLTAAECRAAISQELPAPPAGAQFRSEILSLTGSLARLPAQEEVEFMKPLYPRASVKLWIARDRAFSAFDPVVAALESLAEVAVRDRLPIEARECAEHRALVVISRSIDTPGFTCPEIKKVLLRNEGAFPCLRLCSKTQNPTSDPCAAVALPIPLDRLARFVAQLSDAASS
jgi:hypothetical protein